MAYPSILSSLATPQPTDRLNSPSHSTLHQNENTAITEIETFVGTLPSSAIGTLVYDIRSPDSNGGGHVQSVNKGGTGQVSYAKGDILVAQSSSVLTKLAISSVNGYSLVIDSSQAVGVKWGISGNVPSVIAIATSSIYTVGAGRTYIKVQGIAAGGDSIGSAGGGAGGYGESIIPVSSIVSSIVVSIGSPGISGNKGGNTLFGAFMSMEGGNGASAAAGGLGGSVAGAQIRVTGGKGQSIGTATGQGGSGFYGTTPAFGAGGTTNSASSAIGGYIVITEY